MKNPNATSGGGETPPIPKRLGEVVLAQIKTLEDFKTCRNNVDVEQDKRYLEDRSKDFTSKGWLAQNFEEISMHGIASCRWLGDNDDKAKQAYQFDVQQLYTANGGTGNPYDDTVNRSDFAVSIQLPSQEEPIYASFDATLNADAIEEKLLRSTSDERKQLPFGFTGLDYAYLADGTMLPKLSRVPRYIITMDLGKEQIENYRYNATTQASKITNDKDLKKAERANRALNYFDRRARFMIISEVYEQNCLMLSMLPESNGKDNLAIEDAKKKLDAMDKILRTALRRAADKLPIDISTLAIMTQNEQLEEGDEEALAYIDERKSLMGQIRALNKEIIELKKARSTNPEAKAIIQSKQKERDDLVDEEYRLMKEYVRSCDPNYDALMSTIEKFNDPAKAARVERLRAIQSRDKKGAKL